MAVYLSVYLPTTASPTTVALDLKKTNDGAPRLPPTETPIATELAPQTLNRNISPGRLTFYRNPNGGCQISG